MSKYEIQFKASCRCEKIENKDDTKSMAMNSVRYCRFGNVFLKYPSKIIAKVWQRPFGENG